MSDGCPGWPESSPRAAGFPLPAARRRATTAPGRRAGAVRRVARSAEVSRAALLRLRSTRDACRYVIPRYRRRARRWPSMTARQNAAGSPVCRTTSPWVASFGVFSDPFILYWMMARRSDGIGGRVQRIHSCTPTPLGQFPSKKSDPRPGGAPFCGGPPPLTHPSDERVNIDSCRALSSASTVDAPLRRARPGGPAALRALRVGSASSQSDRTTEAPKVWHGAPNTKPSQAHNGGSAQQRSHASATAVAFGAARRMT